MFFVALLVVVSVPSKLTMVMSSASKRLRTFSIGKLSPEGSCASCLSKMLVLLLRVSPPMVTSPVAEIVTITEPSSCTRQSVPSARSYQGRVSKTASSQVAAADSSCASSRERSSFSSAGAPGAASRIISRAADRIRSVFIGFFL